MPDVVIVGGGPAGLATALHLAARGIAASVIDAATPPIDKACGEGLMPGATDALARLGVRLPDDGAAPFDGIRFIDVASGITAEGRFPHGAGTGARRLHLHGALVERAAAAGVNLRFGERVEAWTPGALQTTRGEVRYQTLVCADGLHSPTRKLAGFVAHPSGRSRYGLRRHYATAPWSRHVEVYWGDEAEAYVTPAGPNRVGVAFLWSGRKARFDDLLAGFPALADRLAGAPVDSRDRGAGPLAWHVPQVVRGDVALVGDASGYLDAITGEGLSLALHQAEALAAAIAAGNLHRYARDHRALVRVPFAMIRLLLWLERHPAVRRRAFQGLAAAPGLFGRILAVNDGASPLSVPGWDLWPALRAALAAPELRTLSAHQQQP